MQGTITVAGQQIDLQMLRKTLPVLMAQQIVGVQPMPKTIAAFKRLPQPKYKFSRAKWYKAEFNSYDYDSVRAWCTEQFGPQPKVADAWTRWFHNYHNIIFFRDEPDYLMFLLRWGQ